jgi:Protein of unknown function (DUF3626)
MVSCGGDISRRRGVFAPERRHSLNDYIEAQVHGVLSLAADVDALVTDPAFAGTTTGELLLATAKAPPPPSRPTVPRPSSGLTSNDIRHKRLRF